MLEMATALPPVSREQAFLETYFQCLSQFAFDKAKELTDKERDASRPDSGSSWGMMINALSQLALAERTYSSLVFLGQKWFGRRDNLKLSYSLLTIELRKIEEQGTRGDPGGVLPSLDRLLAHLCGQLCHFLTARSKTMDFYEQMATMGGMRCVNYEDLLTVITDIIQAHHKNFHHPSLSPVKTMFSLECDIINHLLCAQIEMSNWQFLPSLLHLNDAHTKIHSWLALLPVKESKKFGSFGSSKQPVLPALHQWLIKFKGVLVSKVSLYFNETLNKQSTPADMKSLTAKAAIDFHGRIVTFQKKSDALNISLVFDAHGIEDLVKGHGYHHPNKVTEPPKGLDSYPAIFSYPMERPLGHWPNVIMILTDKMADHNNFDKLNYFYDEKLQSTYYLSQVEQRITFVVIFECKKSERDSYINNFVNDTCTQLRCTKLFAALKPGTKA